MHHFRINRIFVYLAFSILLISGKAFAQETKKYCDSIITAAILKGNRNDHLKSMELLTKAQAMAQRNNWPDQLSSAKINIGANYFALFDYGEALKYYLEAYTIAIKNKNQQNELMALNNIAILYATEKDYKKAHSYFGKAYNLSKKAKDTVTVGIYALNLGLIANDMGDVKLSRRYLDEALVLSKGLPHLNMVVRTGIAENEMNQGRQEQARKMAAELLTGIKEKKGNQTAVSLLLVMAKSYIADKEYAKAMHYTLTALDTNTEDLATEKTIYEIMGEIYMARKQLTEVIVAKDSVFAIQERLTKIKNSHEFQSSKVKFELQDYKNQIVLNEATIVAERKMFYSVLGGLIVVVGLIFMILRNIAMRHKHRKLVAENKQQELELLLVKRESEALLKEKEFIERQHEILLEQENLKQEIEYKNRKLSSKALYVSGKNQLISEIAGMLSDEPEVANAPSVQKHLRYLRNTVNANDEWADFLVHFEEVNQGFLTRLKAKHPELTSNDIRFICYVYMNLNAKEIASMLNISLDACRKRKERVAQKLELKDSTSLYGYLSVI